MTQVYTNPERAKRGRKYSVCKMLSAALLLFPGIYSNAQGPGGITTRAWYKANVGTSVYSDAGTTNSANNTGLHQWRDVSGNGRHLLQATTGNKPIYSNLTSLANFNPTVTFDGSNDWMQYTAPAAIEVIDRSTGTLYASGFANTLKRNGFVGFHPTMDYPGLHMFSTDFKLLFFTGGPGYQGLSPVPFTDQSYFTAGSGWQNGAGSGSNYAGATVSLNGQRTSYGGSQLNNANLSTGARDFRIGGDNNYGSFNGQLNEVFVFDTRLTEEQMDRVETYLSVKYGNTYAAGTKNYKDAAGTTVWNATTNAGFHNNIAGIARDNASELHQKQSWSTNTGQQVLIGIGGLENTNDANTGNLTNGQYLVWGDNGLAKVPTIATSAFSGLSHYFSSIWKVQNNGVGTVRIAWPKGFTNLTLIQSPDVVIDAGDATTPMVAEKVINGVVYNYADVTLSNGSFFTFGVKLASPGGVDGNLRIWLKPDAGFTPSLWTDFSGFGNHYSQTNASRQPFIAAKQYNFNPVVDFGTTGANSRFMAVPSGKPYTANGSNSTIFATSLNRTTPSYSDIIGFGGTTTTASLTQANSPVFITYGSRLRLYPYSASTAPSIPALQINRLYLNDVSYTVGTSGIKYGQNGLTQTITGTVSASNARHASGSILGSQPEARNGLIGELIAYERDLTEAEKQRVRTYTAIKYGVTLSHNYIASNGTTIAWDQTINTGFNNNIAGIANDEGSSLIQKQSNSINDGQQVLISTTGLANSNASNPTALTPGQYLVWGDNGGAKSLSTAFISASPLLNLRMGAVWKVQNTGNTGTVRVAWPAGIPGIHLLKSTTADFSSGNSLHDMSSVIAVDGVSYNYVDVTLENGRYFTFTGYIVGPGGVASAAWYRADALGQQFTDAGTAIANDGEQVYQWNEYKGTGFNLTQTTAGQRPVYSNITKLSNFNPSITFDGSNDRMTHTPAAGIDIIDRARGALFAAGKMTKANNGALLGFGPNMDDPGLYSFSGKLLFYPQIGNYSPQSTNNVAGNLIGGTTWENGAGTGTAPNNNYTLMTLNGYHEVKDNGIRNVINTGNANRLFTVGLDDYAAFGGDLNELVVFGHRLSDLEVSRVESYLAIKYGHTLDRSQNRNYVNSNGNTVWDGTVNIDYYNNIGGIARDDQGALNQKQSWSTNAGRQVLISTTGLANTNAANTGMLNNNQFLVWGDNGLAKSPSVSFGNIAGLPYQRFAAVWKVQNTNSVGTVRVAWPRGYANMKLIQNSTDPTFAAGNTIVEMNNVQEVNGVEYAYADVTLANGQYFTFAAFLQAPGGVISGILMWHKANDGITGAGTKDEWQDVSGNGRDVFQPNSTEHEPLLVTSATHTANSRDYFFNFNPFYYFDGSNDFFYNTDVTYFPSTSSPGSVYGIMHNSGAGGWRTPYGWGDDDPNLNRSGNDYSIWRDNGQTVNANVGASTLPAHIGGMAWNGSANGLYLNVNGRTYSSTTQNIGSIQSPVANLNFAIGSEGVSLTSNGNEVYQGGIPEVFAYSVDHQNATGNEKQRINSYLAIKYGITLSDDAGTAAPDYLSSNSVVVYPADATYKQNIAGIANDFMSALHQKQSRSVNTNAGQVTIALGGEIAETNAANPNSLENGQFLLWGDNGITTAMTNTAATYTPFNYAGSTDNGRRMNRVWKVQNTGVNQEVLIRFPKLSVGTTAFTTGDNCANYVIVFASDAEFSTILSIDTLASSEDDLNYDVSNRFPNGTSYFTYARIKPYSQGTIYLPEAIETSNTYTSTCDIGSWKYYRNESDNSLKLFGMSDYTPTELNNFEVTITPEGAHYDDLTNEARIMSRITTVKNNNTNPVSNGKIRVYYSQDELDATSVPSYKTQGWFKYNGDAEELIVDLYSNGNLNAAKTLALEPDASGVEDGVPYVEFHDISSFSSFFYLSSTQLDPTVPLPVTLESFTVTKQNTVARLNWITATERGNKGFEIERSSDSRNWSSIGFVNSKATNGNSNLKLEYAFDDTKPFNGTNYYRLKQTDNDGKVNYSTVRLVDFSNASGSLVRLYPNPANASVTLSGLTNNAKIVMFDGTGKSVLTTVTSVGENLKTINIHRLASGWYTIVIKNENGSTSTLKFIKE